MTKENNFKIASKKSDIIGLTDINYNQYEKLKIIWKTLKENKKK